MNITKTQAKSAYVKFLIPYCEMTKEDATQEASYKVVSGKKVGSTFVIRTRDDWDTDIFEIVTFKGKKVSKYLSVRKSKGSFFNFDSEPLVGKDLKLAQKYLGGK